MSANDANNSSEVNRGQSDIPATPPNSSSDFVALNSAASSTQPNSAPMVERKTTSATDITDPNTRREMARESRKKARELRKKEKEDVRRIRSAEKSENRRQHHIAKVLFSGKKKIIWITIALVVPMGIFGLIVLVPKVDTARQDAAFEKYKNEYKSIVDTSYDEMASHIFDYEYIDKLPDIKKQIDDNSDKDLRIMLLISYASAIGVLYDNYDEAIDILKKVEDEAAYDYQKEELYRQTIDVCLKAGDYECVDEYKQKEQSMDHGN